jgi:hypothetical protein
MTDTTAEMDTDDDDDAKGNEQGVDVDDGVDFYDSDVASTYSDYEVVTRTTRSIHIDVCDIDCPVRLAHLVKRLADVAGNALRSFTLVGGGARYLVEWETLLRVLAKGCRRLRHIALADIDGVYHYDDDSDDDDSDDHRRHERRGRVADHGVTDKGMRVLIKANRNTLRELILTDLGGTRYSDATLFCAARHCARLEVVDVSRDAFGTRFTRQGLLAIVRAQGAHLSHVGALNAMYTYDIMAAIKRHCTQLRSIYPVRMAVCAGGVFVYRTNFLLECITLTLRAGEWPALLDDVFAHCANIKSLSLRWIDVDDLTSTDDGVRTLAENVRAYTLDLLAAYTAKRTAYRVQSIAASTAMPADGVAEIVARYAFAANGAFDMLKWSANDDADSAVSARLYPLCGMLKTSDDVINIHPHLRHSPLVRFTTLTNEPLPVPLAT